MAASPLALLQALDVLPARQRAAVILRYYHDYDYATIAGSDTTSTNVGAMLSRALDRLKDALEPEPGAASDEGRLSHARPMNSNASCGTPCDRRSIASWARIRRGPNRRRRGAGRN